MAKGTLLRRRPLFLEALEDRRMLAAVPAATLSVPASSFIGSDVNFTVTFDNVAGTNAGYGPFIDLIMPKNGADGATSSPQDGLTFGSAAYLGLPVTSTVLTFPPGTAPTCVAHPYAVNTSGVPLQVCGTPGDQLVVLQLPFGSFTPTQPSATISVTASMSNFADLGTLLPIVASAGFQFGNTPLNDYTTDPSIMGASTTASVNPTLISLTKTYIGPESETATGPNFPRRYTLDVIVADGQTVTDLDVTDLLPNNLAFLSVFSTTPAGATIIETPTVGAAANPPNNALVRRFLSITGSGGPGADASVTFEYFVPQFDANGTPVIDPTTGAAATSLDQAGAQGNWIPLDPRDSPALAEAAPATHTLNDRSLAVQKSVVTAPGGDVAPPGNSPGDTLQYTLRFQVSDFFAFQNVVLQDLLSDGQRLDPSFTPTLSVTEDGSTSSGAFNAANYSRIDHFTGGAPPVGTIDGTQELRFRVSDELVFRGGGLDAKLLGGCVPNGGGAPDCSTNGGPTTGTIVFRSIIQNNFTDAFTPKPHPIVQGDSLSNDVTASGDVLDNSDLTTVTGTVSDTSSAGVDIDRAGLAKSIYAINGDTSFSSPPLISPGDNVTYRLTAEHILSRFENGFFTDYLPLPIFDATTVTTFVPTVSAVAPPAGTSKFGPADTFYAQSGIVPTVTTDAPGNSVEWLYGAYAATPPVARTIDLLFTVQAGNQPFADGLFLTNQARLSTSNSPGNIQTIDSIVQIQLGEPVLDITKGVVATDNPAGQFTPAPPAPQAVSAPGSPNFRFGGTINSANLTATPINSNLSGVDAGDRVTFAIVVENTGSSRKGAFDIQVRDTLPAGFTIPLGGYNLSVTDGTGAAIDCDNGAGAIIACTAADLFGAGLELHDPGPTPASGSGASADTDAGALDQYDPADGRNILVITYDLLTQTSVEPRQTITNTATLFNYAGTEGGLDYTTIDLTDDASVTTRDPSLTKSLVGTSVVTPNNSNTEAVIGETITYSVVITVPEGTTNLARVVDSLDLGLRFVSLGSAVASSGAVTFGPVSTSTAGDGASGTQTITFNLGTVNNTDTNNAVAETITLTYTVRMLNTAGNQNLGLRNNSARFRWTVGGNTYNTANRSAANVTIIEPMLQADKTAVVAGSGTTGQAGDVVTYTIVINHAGSSNTDAYDVTFSDPLPITYVNVTGFTATHSAGGDITALFQNSGGTLQTIPGSSFDLLQGQTVTITVSGTLTIDVQPGQTIDNVATARWTSLDGAEANSGNMDGERNGSGGVNDYAASDGATISILPVESGKTIVGTNQTHTQDLDVAIGEIITYRITARVPQGTTNSVTLVDTLDPGLAIIDLPTIGNNVTVTASSPAVSTTIPGGFLAVANNAVVGAGGSTLSFNFGNVVNSDTNDSTTETIVITYQAVVLNTLANSRDVTRNNSATIRWVAGGAPQSVTVSAPDVTIVEPSLTIDKSNGAPIEGTAGDTIHFTVLVYHAPASNADAFDVTWTDIVPNADKMTYVPGSLLVVNAPLPVDPTTPTTPPTSVDAGGNLSVTWAAFPVGGSSTISFDVTLNADVHPNELLVNTADVTWTSLPGNVTTPQSSNPLSVERTGNPTDPGGAANDYRAEDSGIVLTPPTASEKVVLDTSEPSTGTAQYDPTVTDLTIGETVLFGLIVNFIDGVTNSVVLTDNLPTSPAVLEYVSTTLVFVGDNLSTDAAGLNPVTLPVPVLSDTNGDGVIDRVVLNFGTIWNAMDGDDESVPADEDTLVVGIRARALNYLPSPPALVPNTEATQSGQHLTNVFVYTDANVGPLTSTADVDIVEPNLSITKSASPTSVDGGDTVTFTMTVDHTGVSSADAFDLAVADTLPAGLTYAGNVVSLSGPGPAVTVAGPDLTFFWNELPLGGGPYTFTFDVTVDATITPGQTFLNVADLEWSTLPGPDPNERTYTDSDSAEVISSSTTLRDPAKSLIVTSESSTPDAPPTTLVAIGEIVRYRLQAELTEGRFPSLTFVDTLPLGMSFLDPGQVRLSFTSDVPMTVVPSVLEGANGGAMPPTFVLPVGFISTSTLPSGQQQITFDLGTVTNNDNDAGAELVTLEFNVLVDNTVNDNAGEVKSNAFQAFVNGVQYGVTQSVPVTIVEPLISDVAKQFVSMSGNQRTFQISFSNTGTTTAFDTLVTDAIPAGASLNVGPISVTLGGGATGAGTVGSTLGLLQVTIDEMPVGGTVVIQYSVTLTAASQTGLLNSVNVGYTSLPGDSGTAPNPTGSVTPGAPGDPNGERTGAGGVNDLLDGDNETLGSLGDLVWYDLNGNRAYNPGEPGLPNVDMTAVWAGPDGIFGTADDVTLTTTTNALGIYFFNALPPGNYRVTVDTADTLPRIPSYDLDGVLDSTTVVTLGVGEDFVDADFGYTDPSTITGVKYSDTSGNGVRDPGEPPIANVRIYIDTSPYNQALDTGERTTVTNATGNYTLGGLLPGTYIVRELRPDYTVQTAPGGDGSHAVVIVVPGTTVPDRDFGNQPVAPQIIDNGDPGFVIEGGWERARCWIFLGSDAQYLCSASPGTGSNYVEWNFTGLTAGATYRVSTTWYPASGLSQDAPYTATGGSTPVTVRFNQTRSPSTYPGSFTAQGVWWADIDAAYTIVGTTLSVRLSDDHSGGCLLADAVRIIQDTTPEIRLLDGSAELTSGSSTVNLGSTIPGTPLLRTFTVRNDGGADLALGTITLPAGYSLAAPLGQTTLAAGATTTFTVQLNALALGTYAGAITVGNNDNNEAPFTFNIVGVVGNVYNPNPQPAAPVPAPAAPALPLIDVHNGATPLISGLSGIDFGTTTVGNASNRVLTVTNRGTAELLLGTIVVPSPGFSASPLGDAVLSPGESTTFTVGLITSLAGTYTGDLVLYDAASQAIFTVGLAGVVNAPLALLLPLILDNGVGVAGYTASGFTYSNMSGFQGDVHYTRGDASGDAATWVFGGLPVGQYRVSATYVKGTSRATNAPYTLTGVTGGPQTVLVNQQLAPSDRTDQGVGWKDLGVFMVSGGALSVRLTDAANGYVYADAIRVEQISAGSPPAAPLPPPLPPPPPPPPPPLSTPVVIDNGQGVAGFIASGMTYYTLSGYQGDVSYTRGDNTGDYALWTFTGLPSGSYRISTTWVKGTSRASNAPYTLTGVYGGPANVLRNQQVAPDDLTWDGIAWEDLGTFQITTGTLTVRLTDNANGYVYADAVRVEQLNPLVASEFGAGLLTPPEPATAGLPTTNIAAGLSSETLAGLTRTAVAFWAAADAGAAARLSDVQVRIEDLPAGILGLAAVHSDTIWIDLNADGHGWFVDQDQGRRAKDEVSGSAFAPYDLLTALAHELGHLLGHFDDYDDSASSVMDFSLPAGVRRLTYPSVDVRASGTAVGGSLSSAGPLVPLDEFGSFHVRRGRDAAGLRADAGLGALLAEQPAAWPSADEDLARLPVVPRKRADDPEQRRDEVLSSVGDWLDPLDEILARAM